jgi:hypothetical protein
MNFIKSANSIVHNPFRLSLINSNLINEIFHLKKPIDVQEEFLSYYKTWIESSKLNKFSGLDNFNQYVSLGVTQGIDDFISYCYKSNRQLKIFKGEYPYVRSTYGANIKYIDESPLQDGDAVILSTPFSATGDLHSDWLKTINICNQLSIPIFVDCAFFGTCENINVTFDEPCIDTVAFSLTKGLNCGNFRSGIVFTKRKNSDSTLDIQTEWHHGIHLNTAIGLHLMKNFSPDTLSIAYKQQQLEICRKYNLIPSKCVHLALGDDNWKDFTRDGVSNRVGLREFFTQVDVA